MKRITAFILIFQIAIWNTQISQAVDFGFAAEDGGQAGAFLDSDVTARSIAMGGAHTAVADDASAVHNNPAGLARIERKDMVAHYSSMWEDTSFGSLHYAQPTVDLGTFGMGLLNLRSGKFEKRDVNRGQQGSFDLSEMGLFIAHGMSVGETMDIGSSVKFVRQQIDTFSDTGYGLDLGAMWRMNSVLRLGFTARNVLAPEIKLKSQKESYARDYRAGLGFQALRKLLVAMDLSKTDERAVKINIGGEWKQNDLLSLRAGFNEKEVSAGLGLAFGDWGIDYAFAFHGAAAGVKDLGDSHRFGIRAKFGKLASEQEASLRWQRKGQESLVELSALMDMETPDAVRVRESIDNTRQVIRRQGYLKPQDLYAAQAYISYFEGEHARSVQSFAESLTLDPSNTKLVAHLEKAKARMSAAQAEEIIATELKVAKELYAKGEWKGTLRACEKILSLNPDHIDARAYWEDAKTRIMEPIQRELKIGKQKLERGDYLDAVKSFQRVQRMDPQNSAAAQYMTEALSELEKQATQQVTVTPVVTQATESATAVPVYEMPKDMQKSRALYSQGLVLYSQGKVKEAAAMWSKAVELDSGNMLAKTAYNRAAIELKESH